MAFDTNTQTLSATSSDIPADPQAAMTALLGDTPWRAASRLPDADASIEEIEQSGIFAGCESREAYLAWVARYKATINATADHIREQKRLRRSPDEGVAWSAASKARSLGDAATTAIAMRRLGKRWSAARAEAARTSRES